MSASSLSLVGPMVQQQITYILHILVNIVFPTIEQTFHAMQHVRQPYHMSILSGEACVQELIHGHPRHIRTELGVQKRIFKELVFALHRIGHQDSKYVTLEEQLAIFLYTCVSGLTSAHVGERFQRSGETISRFVGYIFNFQSLIFFIFLLFSGTFGRWPPYSVLVHSTQIMSINLHLHLPHIFETIQSFGHF